MYRILCVEDTSEIQIVIRQALCPIHELVFAPTIKDARIELANGTFDLMLLDIGLPDGDGLRFCAELKASQGYQKIPVFILTGNHSIHEKTLGFQLGIEDFIVKPFDPIELRLRIDSRLKKINETKSLENEFSIGNLRIDLAAQRASLKIEDKFETLELSSTEFKILCYLSKHKDQVKSREQIISAAWKDGMHLSDRTIDSHISRIRKKILKCTFGIEAIIHSGYRFSAKQVKNKAA